MGGYLHLIRSDIREERHREGSKYSPSRRRTIAKELDLYILDEKALNNGWNL